MTDTLAAFLDTLDADIRARADWGAVASYIPELARIDPAQFAISVALADGQVLNAGDSETRFSIQSVSKVFSLACVLARIGEGLWRRVGREPSGDRFDSILLLEQEQGRPRNPFINAGALVTTDELLAGRAPREALSEIIGFVRASAGDDDIHIDRAVAESEKATGYRNVALANYLKSYGNLVNAPDLVLGTYFHQCAIEMTTRQLALAGRGIAGLPGAPFLLNGVKRRRIAALMMTCGHYDGSGDFAFRTGLPGKSGVGGGILIAVPGRASVAIWSPGLNAWGNSKCGTEAAERLARFTGWSVFG
ncbi:glutaminase [Ponticoccus alexandrii]|uniref:Glutaminase n=1 Tax=Ponticoccus alexandrii TaxID=1943633 RepID=A0ABX7FAM0_9RHOB|nr:glutaminase [Ponticoccus alexandrii]ETA52336.1 glutaminase [Rhodobacteraceae bacterium PD-2]QRF67534.1 glutaminase [Ponticoccus alexandrii]